MPKPAKTPAAPNEPILSGFPEHGDPPRDGPTPEEQADDDDGDDEQAPNPPEEDTPAVKALKTEIAELRRQIPPATPKEPRGEVKDPLDDTNWDQEIFSKPGDAVKKIVKASVDRAVAQVRQEYNAEQGKEKFWQQFYAKNKDLKRDDDHDLVEMVLSKNLKDLANIPVADALTKLADLTRDRIMKYTGGQARKGKRAVAEGSAPTAPRTPPEKPKVPGSLSEVLKNRRNQRRGVAA